MDEYNNDALEPEVTPEPQPQEEEYTSAFAQTVFAPAEQPQEPVREEPVMEDIESYSAEAQAELTQEAGAEEPQAAEQPVYAQQNPYGTQNPYYTQQSIPPYGQPQGSACNTGYQQAPFGYTPYAQQTAPAEQPVKKKKGLRTFFVLLAAVVIIGIAFACGAMLAGRNGRSVEADEKTRATAAADAPEFETKASPSASNSGKAGAVLTPTQIAAKARTSSVAILVYSSNKSGLSSEGSGVLWKEDDTHTYTYIITCAHVINGTGSSYTVQTEDGTTYDAEMVGADAKTDLGVVRIKATGLQLAEFGDSGALQVGDPVYAIGNPGGTEFFGSFTGGIVSAIDRSVQSTYTMLCIQHTAAINPGNSGGALVNQYGQVIGINSQKIISDEYEGMGFAIPIKSAQSIINSLASYGYVPNRPRLGITYTEAVNYQQFSMIIKIRGLPSGSLIINEISEDGALAGTDARQYDMIIAVDGEDLNTPDVLLDKIENGKVGDKLKLTLCRVDNNYQISQFDITVTLVEEKKEAVTEATTSPQYINPYDFFNDDFFNGLF